MSFDEEDFPLSPQVESYSLVRNPGEFLVAGHGTWEQFQASSTEFSGVETAYLQDVPAGDYSFHITVEGRDDDPVIVFDAVPAHGGAPLKTIRMNQRQYMTEFVQALEGTSGPVVVGSGVTLEDHEFEIRWSILYLQNIFKDQLEGNMPFWEHFYDDLDMALIPVNLRMDTAMEGTHKTVRVVYGGPDIQNRIRPEPSAE